MRVLAQLPAAAAALPVQRSPMAAKWVNTMLREYFEDREHPRPAEEAIHFMRAHASTTFTIPTTEVVERLAMEQQIITSLKRDPCKQTAARLADQHNIPRRQVSKAFKRGTGIGLETERAAVAAARSNVQHCRHVRLAPRRFRVRV